MHKDGERLSRINEALFTHSREHLQVLNLRQIIEEADTAETVLMTLAQCVSDRFPIITHRYSLANQVLLGADACQTDCRFSAVLLGMHMDKTHLFDQIALCVQSSADLHIGVIGVSQGIIYHTHFFDSAPGFKVSNFTPEKLGENKLFTVDAKGIARLDKYMMVV